MTVIGMHKTVNDRTTDWNTLLMLKDNLRDNNNPLEAKKKEEAVYSLILKEYAECT